MKKPLLFASMIAALAVGSIALADDNDCYVPMSKWQSREAVRTMAQQQGWDIQRLKIDDGCYEIKGYDANGAKIEVKIDPATLVVIEMEYKDHDHDEEKEKHSKKRKKGKKSNRAAPMSPLNPPDNGLFAPKN